MNVRDGFEVIVIFLVEMRLRGIAATAQSQNLVGVARRRWNTGVASVGSSWVLGRLALRSAGRVKSSAA